MGEKMKPKSIELRCAINKLRRPKPEPDILTVAEACAYLRISKWKLYKIIRERQLATMKIGRRRLIERVAIEQVKKQFTAEAEEER